MIKKRRNGKSTITNIDNLSYLGEVWKYPFSCTINCLSLTVLPLMATVVRESDLQSSDNSSLAPYYDYSSVNEENQTSPTESQETIYATVANGGNQNHGNVQNAGVGQYDYTVIYDDPTSTSYVVGVYIYRLLLLSLDTMKLVFHCSLRYIPVEVYLMLLGHMYLHW